MESYREITNCRGCGGQAFFEVINLGQQYVVDFVKEADEGLLRSPLHLIRCVRCNLVQLQHSVNPDRLYRKFWYRSGVNEQMRKALKDVAVSAFNAARPRTGHAVLDIGANDGTLLSMFPSNLVRVGVDPCSDLLKEAVEKKRLEVAINDYFSVERCRRFGPYSVITAIAMFYDLEDPLDFLIDCRELLAPDGVLVIQMNYLKSMLQNVAVDNICAEHLTYFSVSTLKDLVQRAGLSLAGVELVEVNGGSFRAYICLPDDGLSGLAVEKQVSLYASAAGLMLQEQGMELDKDTPYLNFRKQADGVLAVLQAYLREAHESGERIYLYGASTRGSTLMQCMQIEPFIKAAADRDPHKWGLKMVGTWIPIISEEEARKDATLFLVLPWHFRESIEVREHDWVMNGGKLLFPLPQPVVCGAEGETQLLTHVGGVL